MMTKINDGGPAFPSQWKTTGSMGQPVTHFRTGMTLRQYYIGQALAGLSQDDGFTVPAGATWGKMIAKRAIEIADALIAAEPETEAKLSINSTLATLRDLLDALPTADRGIGYENRGVAFDSGRYPRLTTHGDLAEALKFVIDNTREIVAALKGGSE